MGEPILFDTPNGSNAARRRPSSGELHLPRKSIWWRALDRRKQPGAGAACARFKLPAIESGAAEENV
ncbi:MAG: hypothetical protein OTI36_17910 [Beijerinckiaceae bacterium]|nr:hypothetical protein [Beijerinckiaceae bacterium]